MFSDAVSYRRDFPPAELGLRQVCRADQAKSASAHQRSQSPRRRVTCVRRKRLELGASWRTSELLFHLCPIRHIDDAILERGLEESNVRFWFVHFARLLVFRHVEVEYVVKHEAKVGVWVDSRFNFHGGFVCQFEMRGELAAAEARLGEALALFGPALEHCQIFYRRIVASVPVVLWFASWQTGQCGKRMLASMTYSTSRNAKVLRCVRSSSARSGSGLRIESRDFTSLRRNARNRMGFFTAMRRICQRNCGLKMMDSRRPRAALGVMTE